MPLTRSERKAPEKRATAAGVKKAQRRVERILELPAGMLGGNARLEIMGNRQAVIEGCRGILQYDEDAIRISTASGIVVLRGRGLTMSCLTKDSAAVAGFLLSIEFMV